MFEDLWIEKYRPGTFDDIVLSDRNRELLTKITTQKSIPNLLFAGKPGIGKTSLAKILVNDVLQCQYLYINASDENGIDTIRTKVTNFSKIRSIDGAIKVIILDEVDGLTIDAQRALRNTMEEYSQFVRFILTANFNHKVIPPLQSRCQSFDLTPDITSYTNRIEQILASESVKHEEISTLVKRFYPDLRKCVNELQKLSVDGVLKPVDSKNLHELTQNILLLIKNKKTFQTRKFVINKESEFGSDYQVLLKNLFEDIDKETIDIGKKRECLLTISEYMYRSAFVLDQEINFYSCILAISRII
jgi:DNA polymerase III delta prime subunit